METIESWLVDWFSKASKLPAADIRKSALENYFTQGWIDSFRFITLIGDAEKQFSVQFSNEEFQDRNFVTITGLAKIIYAKRAGK